MTSWKRCWKQTPESRQLLANTLMLHLNNVNKISFAIDADLNEWNRQSVPGSERAQIVHF